MNIIQADAIHFISSDFKKKLKRFCGPLKVFWTLSTVPAVSTGKVSPIEQWVGT